LRQVFAKPATGLWAESISAGWVDMHKVSVIIEKDAHGYYAFSPDLPGCQTQGDSLEEAVTNIKEAIALYLETLSQEELHELANKEIFSTTVEVSVA
jgi:predicted RNase H-like HicB family nuclease